MIKLSIIVPVYNKCEYLEECLDSLIPGLECGCEIILIDDDSTDGAEQICDLYAKKYKDTKVAHQKNSGVSASRNRGIKMAHGQFIMFVDSDDVLKNGWTKILNLIENQDIIYLDNKLNKNLKKDELHSYITGYKDTSLYKPGPVSKVFRREFLLKDNLKFDDDIIFAEDQLFNLKALLKAKKIEIINEDFYTIRKTDNGLTRAFNEKIFASTEKFISEIEKIELGKEGEYLKQIQTFNLALRISRLTYKEYMQYIKSLEKEPYKSILHSKYVVQRRFKPFLTLVRRKHYTLAYLGLKIVRFITRN